jgi:hypothetical protein
MDTKRNSSVLRRGLARVLAAACLLLVGAVGASAQGAPAGDPAQEFTMTDLLKLPGRVVGKGSNAAPRGLMKLRSYRVEEVALPRVTEVELRGQRVTVTKAFRVTVTGGPFAVRALPPVVWVGDVAVGYGVESEDLTEITAVTYDESLLRDGAPLYLSYGDKETLKDRTALPERLKLDAKGANQ